MDRSKAASIAKGLTCLQILWFLIAIVGRASERPHISTLEVLTLTNIGCATVAYTLWWNKPKDVTKPYAIYVSEEFGANKNALITLL